MHPSRLVDITAEPLSGDDQQTRGVGGAHYEEAADIQRFGDIANFADELRKVIES